MLRSTAPRAFCPYPSTTPPVFSRGVSTAGSPGGRGPLGGRGLPEKGRKGMVAVLSGKVALVAGATRGAGRGTAVALGEAGAVVYCTGRTTSGRRSEYDRPETIEETAELVTAAGGTGIAAAVDHREPSEV